MSHDVDGELSQLERVFLAGHLRRCGECAGFAADVRAFTGLVRSAPLERLEREFVFPARRRTGTRVIGRVALASALVAVAGGLGVLAGWNGGAGGQPRPSSVGDVAFAVQPSADREIRDLRRVEVEQPRERITPPGRLGGNV